MDLLDRYITEIGKNLPRRTRTDIQAEIRSTLQDMLEDRSRETGRPVDDELTSQVLKEYGAPAKIAQAYKTRQYLVGPRLFPIFGLVLKIVLTVLFAVSLAGLGISVVSTSMSGPDFATSLLRFAGQFLAGSITAFGNIVLIFAILERVLPASEFEQEAEDWDPAELTREPDPDQTKRREVIGDIVFTILALVVFNLYPQVIGLHFMVAGHWISVPLLSEAFFVYLPWLNLLWVLTLVLDVVLLRTETWTVPTRVAKIVLSLAEIALAIVMLTGPSLVNVTPEVLAGTPLGEAAGTLAGMLNLIPLIVLGVLIIINTIEVGQLIYRLFTPRPAPVFPDVK
jgi:hypothetical protein